MRCCQPELSQIQYLNVVRSIRLPGKIWSGVHYIFKIWTSDWYWKCNTLDRCRIFWCRHPRLLCWEVWHTIPQKPMLVASVFLFHPPCNELCGYEKEIQSWCELLCHDLEQTTEHMRAKIHRTPSIRETLTWDNDLLFEIRIFFVLALEYALLLHTSGEPTFGLNAKRFSGCLAIRTQGFSSHSDLYRWSNLYLHIGICTFLCVDSSFEDAVNLCLW